MKKYKVGMYGGKFMPFHKGHFHCVEVAAAQCEILYVLMLHGGDQEQEILKQRPNELFLTPEDRIKHIKEGCKCFENVRVVDIDITNCRNEDGTENWEMETPLVLNVCGKLDAVYSSEPSYSAYFENAYPGADIILVDVERKDVPISATMIRSMDEEERKKWII